MSIYRIKINGKTYEMEIELIEEGKPKKVQPAPVAPKPVVQEPVIVEEPVEANPNAITAPMPGSIIQVMVKPGDEVAENDVILILEAMKMENEVQAEIAKNIVIGFARIDGEVIGIVANNPKGGLSGSLDIDSSEKAARFVRFCDCFNIPILTLVDVPGFMPGTKQEHGGIIRRGAKLLYAYAEATVPKVTLILRKAFGGAYIAMNSKGMGADIVFAWPIAQTAVMGAEGAVAIMNGKQIDAATDPAAERARLVSDYENEFMTPYIAAEKGYIDEVILPEETRRKIRSAFEALKLKDRNAAGFRAHGNIPL